MRFWSVEAVAAVAFLCSSHATFINDANRIDEGFIATALSR